MNRRAFTMIEMLVSLAITMIMMLAVVTLFQVMTDSVSGSRALLEAGDRLRACRNRLQADLQGATATMLPPLRPENDEGYFEIIEGSNSDRTFSASASIFGDADDALMFTVRSRGEPFVGKLSTSSSGTIESQVAEVIYFTKQNGPVIDPTTTPPTQLFTLYRRVLLVAPGITSISTPAIPAAINGFYDRNDISARFTTTAGGTPTFMVANTLGDLTKRENRFAHYGASYPATFPFNVNTVVPPAGSTLTPTQPNNNAAMAPLGPMTTPPETRLGDDVLMTNVLAFDVQVYDQNAPVQVSGGVAICPPDAGFNTTAAPTTTGAYADLGYVYSNASTTPLFNNASARAVSPAGAATAAKIFLNPTLPAFGATTTSTTYDTWSLHYENNGIADNLNATLPADAGTNGLDDNVLGEVGYGVVDDVNEFDTQPPFADPLRGIRVIVRVYEPSSQQVREIVVMQDFLPE